jgi:hypothetical protein
MYHKNIGPNKKEIKGKSKYNYTLTYDFPGYKFPDTVQLN